MYRIRAKFMRGEELKYISHLDIMRIFERAIRRSRLPIKYSEGFNPRPEMVFGLPLSVGMTSEADYADFNMYERVYPLSFIDSLNPQMPDGMKILAAAEIHSKANIMALVEAALYNVEMFSEDPGFHARVADEIAKIMDLKEMIVEKKGKSGTKKVDIRPFILKAEVWDIGEISRKEAEISNNYYGVCLSLLVSAGSRGNLNPGLLIEELDRNAGLGVVLTKIHRKELYIKKGERLCTPFDE